MITSSTSTNSGPTSIDPISQSSAEKKTRVFIFGGGVAGLSAAHELAKFTEFEVHVFERDEEMGGKARSRVPAGLEGRFAAEHGFRLFPHFYRHLTDTLREIPFNKHTVGNLVSREPGERLPAPKPGTRMAPADGTVWGNLIGSTEAAYARRGILRLVQRPFPHSGIDFARVVREMLAGDNLVTETDLAAYSWMILKYMTACSERREEEFERMTWLEYLGVGKGIYSAEFERLIRSVPRVLSAMRPDVCSARSVGNSTLQLLFDFSGNGGNHMESVLAGPTQEAWLNPWRKYLHETCRVEFYPGARLESFEFEKGRISAGLVAFKIPPQTEKAKDWSESIGTIGDQTLFRIRSTVLAGGQTGPTLGADYFIAALPLEVMQRLLGRRPSAPNLDSKPVAETLKAAEGHVAKMKKFDPSLANICKIERGVEPMVGIQFFLNRDVKVCNGHVFYPDSPWALTSISQAQFWERFLPGRLAHYLASKTVKSDAAPRGILSVIISDWVTPRLPRPEFGERLDDEFPAAKDLDEAAIKREVWQQIKEGLNQPGAQPVLSDDDLWHGRDELRAIPAGTSGKAYGAKLDALLVDDASLDENAFAPADRGKPGKRPVRVYEGKDGHDPAPSFTPLFVHPKGSYALRPDAELRIPNLLLASDYVRTNTDLATMEAANEAAKRAALAILRREVPACQKYPALYQLSEGRLFAAAQEIDRLLYVNAGGQPHIMDTPRLFLMLAGGLTENVVQFGLGLLGIARRPPPDLMRTGPARTMAHVELAASALKSASGLADALRASVDAFFR